LDSQQAMREDLRRRLAAEVSADYREWEALGPRIDAYEQNIIAPTNGRIDASLAEYRSGAGPFSAVFDARQALLDAELSLLELRLQRLRLALKLRYFASES
jgi:outer membrane protein TolC